ncbi:MAG: S-layer homology domain-containing protein, partial [Oscillospiraceae bacterium]
SPHLFWSRSFPETATLTGGSVPLTGYILDDGTLASVTLNGSEAPNITKTAEGFWQFTKNITENGVLNLSAIDTSGNRTTRNTRIDWFNTSASAGSKNAPTLDAKLVKANGEELVGYLGKNESAFISATSNATGTPKVSASYYGKNAKGGLEKTPLAAGDDGRFAVANNGFYVVTAQNTEAQEWSARVLYMDKKDQSAPMVTLKKSDTVQQSEGGLALVWSAQKADKKATATIASANINGNVLPVAPDKTWVGGSFPVTHAGEYILTAEDTAGNSATERTTLTDIPVKNPGGTLAAVTNAWNHDGSVAVDITNIVGGKYDAGKSNKVTNSYKGSYEWNLSGQSDWQTNPTGTVSSLAPGAYTLSVRDANDKENAKTILTETLTVGDEAVALTLTKATVGGGVGGGSALHTLDWTAKKGVGSSENITKITMNGKDIAVVQGKELSGSLPLEYGGDYELIATSDGRPFTKTETVAGIPLTTPSKDALLTIEKPWNTALNNGKLTINLTTGATQKNLTGGKYDPAVLSAENAYVGSYEWRLEPAVSHANSEAEAAWLAEQVAKPDGWATSALSDLSVGNYILIIQDAQDRGNAATALTIPVAITSELVTFKATPKLASKASVADGAIDVEAFGGYHSQNVFQFAARPMKDENSMGTIETVTAPLGIEYPEEDGWKQPAWQLGDLAKSAPNQSALSGLRAGWYQVAVRTMLGVTTADMTALINLYKTYTDAVTAKAEESVIEIARLAYEAKKTTMENASNSGYTATPGLWANAATIAVYVPATAEPGIPSSGQVKTSDFDYKTEGVVQVMLSAKKPILSPKAQAQLIADNKNKDLVIGSPMMEVRIPAGTLAEGDDLNAMLMPTVALPQDASGYVVQYTDKDGVTHLLPLSRVTSEKVTYMASEPGSYSLVQNTKHFDDVPAGFWGEDEIYFVTERGLFQGADKDRFGHTETMTRGMFVTVLGRLAGANPAEYGETPFTDVTADSWYGGYAAWASKNNIVGGIGEKLFDPGAPVSREQMCVMLVRYLEWAKIILPVAESEQNFADQSEISTWAEQAIRQLVAAGIIKGTESGALRPGAEASRAEVATIYARLIEAILGA